MDGQPMVKAQNGAEQKFPIEMKAAIVPAANSEFEMASVHLSAPLENEVLVKIVATGICHTDLSVQAGELPTALPAILGHEGAGIVESVGSNVTEVAPGDHVVLGFLSCGECRPCSSGHPAACADFGALCFGGARPDGSHAVSGADGTVLSDRFFGQSSFAPFAIADKRCVVKVRTDVQLDLLGPLGCGIMTGAGAVWNALSVTPGTSFAVFGSGAVGLGAAMAARVAGATIIVCIDTVPSRLELAKELGATHVIDARSDDVAGQVFAATGHGVDAALDTTGRADGLAGAVQALAQRGRLAVVANSDAAGEHKLPLMDMIMGSKSIIGVVEGGTSAQDLVPKLIDLFAEGRFPFDRLVKFYSADQINQAAADSLSGKIIKPIIRFD